MKKAKKINENTTCETYLSLERSAEKKQKTCLRDSALVLVIQIKGSKNFGNFS